MTRALQASSPIGRVSRGVVLGDGKVFVTQADATLSALDQRTGAVDPELGQRYFTMANPGPDLNGSVSECDTLFANSIVVLFDANVQGRPRAGSRAPGRVLARPGGRRGYLESSARF